MKESLFKKFQKLQRTKNDLLRRLNDLNYDQLNTPAEKDKWSIAQILYHIHLSETRSLQYMRKKSSNLNELKKASFSESVKTLLLKLMLSLPIKYKAPEVISVEMPAEIDWQQLLLDWGNTRDEIYKFISALPEDALDKKIFRHPAIGLMSIFQAVDFFQSHFNHHLSQVRNHLSKFEAPTAG